MKDKEVKSQVVEQIPSKVKKSKKIKKQLILEEVKLIKVDKKSKQSKSKTDTEDLTKKQQPKQKQGFKLHMNVQMIENRIQVLEKEILGDIPKSRRKRIFQQLSKLRKGLNCPESLVDPEILSQKYKLDKQKRISKKISKSQGENAKSKCLVCKQFGHLAAECAKNETMRGNNMNIKVCYNCGKNDHTAKDCKKKKKQNSAFATCFFCGDIGHIVRECPKNEKGLYSQGGGCYQCGSVRHTKKECPELPDNVLQSKFQPFNHKKKTPEQPLEQEPEF